MNFNRAHYFNYIEARLTELAVSIGTRGKLNILDFHNHSEDFFVHLLNELYDWSLKNVNPFQNNVEAIDLIDDTKKFVVQVSATNTVTKVEASLGKDLIKKHQTFRFKFVSINGDCKSLRSRTFENPHGISFTPSDDIIDRASILKTVKGLGIDKLRSVYELVKKELGNPIDVRKMDSHLASIIYSLSNVEWSIEEKRDSVDPFEIQEKISHNGLKRTRNIIDDYKIYHHKVDEKYSEFDKAGANKSFAVLQVISRFYSEENEEGNSPDDIFFRVCGRVIDIVTNSGNYQDTEFETLQVCVDILVVDAFIRCKIFENPNLNGDAAS